MTHLKSVFSLFTLLLICFPGSLSVAAQETNLRMEIVKVDPEINSTLGSNEKLYALVHYESAAPLRFQAIGMFEDAILEVGSIKNPGVLHAPGDGDALVWVSYTNPTHIDAVKVTVLDEDWQVQRKLTKEVDMTWQGNVSASPREPAEWVKALIKTERREMDFVYDPEPQKNETVYDILFFFTIASIPAYILLQLHMLWRYQYRWRELAVIPIFPYLIVAFYGLVGLDIDTSLQVTFLFRYTPLALLYLICLWIAKRFWQDKLPPPKLYKPPKK
jgi:hypothetical protein